MAGYEEQYPDEDGEEEYYDEAGAGKKGLGHHIEKLKAHKEKVKAIGSSPGAQHVKGYLQPTGKASKFEQLEQEADEADLGEAANSDFAYNGGQDYLGRPIVVVEVDKLIVDPPEETANSFFLLLRTIRDACAEAESGDVNWIMVINFCQDIPSKTVLLDGLGVMKRLHDVMPGYFTRRLHKVFLVHPQIFCKMFIKSSLKIWHQKAVFVHNMWFMFSEVNYQQIHFSAEAYRLDVTSKLHRAQRKDLAVPSQDLLAMKNIIEQHIDSNQQSAQRVLESGVNPGRHAPYYMKWSVVEEIASGARETLLHQLFDQFDYAISANAESVTMSTRHFTKILLAKAEATEIDYWYDFYANKGGEGGGYDEAA